MPSIMQILYAAPAMFALANAQGVLVSAQGAKGSPASVGLQVDQTKADANIINAADITTNISNECGRTLLAGNIDIGTVTEAALLAKQVTSVTKGSSMTVKIKAIDANGAGPYSCDMDQTSNSLGSGQTVLAVKEKAAANGDVTLTVTMPKDMKCVGASTGNVCTVRCFNKAAAGPFGGCVAVQQTDVTPTVNSPNQITTAQTKAGIDAQVAQNIKDLAASKKAIADAPTEDQQALFAANALLGTNANQVAAGAAGGAGAAAANNTAVAGGAAAGAATGAAAGAAAGGKKKGKKNKNKNNGAAANAGAANAGAATAGAATAGAATADTAGAATAATGGKKAKNNKNKNKNKRTAKVFVS